MSALRTNRTRRDGRNDMNDPNRSLCASNRVERRQRAIPSQCDFGATKGAIFGSKMSITVLLARKFQHGPPAVFFICSHLAHCIPVSARAVDEIQVYNAEIAKVGQWTFQLHNNYAFIGRKEPDFPGGLVPN